MQTLVIGSIFIPDVFRVCFESPFYEDDIQPEIQVPPNTGQTNNETKHLLK